MPATSTASRHLAEIAPFLSKIQFKAIADRLKGQEARHFESKLQTFAERIRTMPTSYEQETKGDDAVAYLHYFIGNHNYWVTEKDMVPDGTVQAYGLASADGLPEKGYISIAYITGHHELFDPEFLPNSEVFTCAELDLYFEPKTIAEIKTSLRNVA